MKKIKKNEDSNINKPFVRNKKSETGITLIALVITIIVLLILAVVTIAMLTGENGIITKTNEAKTTTAKKEAEEAINLVLNEWQIEKHTGSKTLKEFLISKVPAELDAVTGEGPFEVEKKGYKATVTADGIIEGELIEIGGTIPTPPVPPAGNVEPGELVEETNKLYTNNGTAIIPVGFAIVPTLNDVSNGLVISDVANDTTDTGNQFVWIPVAKETFETKFKRTEGYYNGNLDSSMSYTGEAGADGNNSKVTESDTTKSEAIAMYASVKENGGFYIARYEAGKEGEKVVSKKGATVWTDIQWGNGMSDDKRGAVEKARGLYNQNGYKSVKSTLCYGVQWDATMNFMDPKYITNEVEGKPNCNEKSYVRDSTGKGNYATGSYVPTGSNNNYAVKNIYDMAGNVIEWTMESYYTDYRVYRRR